MPVGRKEQIVDCRAVRGLGEGGGLAQRGTFAEGLKNDVVVVAMSPGRRHITKPVCEITYGIREAGIQTSVLVLNAGSGLPHDTPKGSLGSTFGLKPEEAKQVNRHKLCIVHLGNVKSHIIYKARLFLRYVKIPTIIVCQTPIDMEDFAKIGVKTKNVMPVNPDTEGTIVDIITGVVRGESATQLKIDETIEKIKNHLN
ncbi:methyl-coenzyme M reductase I operon protein C [Methanococcus aeolicus]|jgi:methyl-coenzyme M reductase subunit C|uniref:Methyl-coenzyme M reductase operon protein C n=1 Tax=Methanococcus aeolicus (strain ATCC BAA-1280 / DSM 17508 / OCM 812 / Nankai-3) TaxID=419665 RepID=A6UWH0_META3|nr:methyl-coenzyme M reductase I operon protein C [Methanococcus aeolicus]ABR56842.1 Methyl-coenzyme M reductase operon protein C [Methanococcus aeolicus Nankai-3]UXM84843.1 methyl-coenzyme M reductase I operon protein C [Methanococcus aeolicus]